VRRSKALRTGGPGIRSARVLGGGLDLRTPQRLCLRCRHRPPGWSGLPLCCLGLGCGADQAGFCAEEGGSDVEAAGEGQGGVGVQVVP